MKPRVVPRLLLRQRTRWPHHLRIRPDCCHHPWGWAQGKPSTVLRKATPSSPAQPWPLPKLLFSHGACLHWTKNIATVLGHGAARRRAVVELEAAVSWWLILQMTSAQRIQWRLPLRQAANLLETWAKASSPRYTAMVTCTSGTPAFSYL
jgi:hypothetical protein